MEWPTIDVLANIGDQPLLKDDEEYIENMTMTLVTKEIYARAANAAISNITVDHKASGLEERVKKFLESLRGDDEKWATEYRAVAREFTELLAEAKPRSRALEMCRGGLAACHDLLKFRVPREKGDDPHVETPVLNARDAFVLCQSLPELETNVVTGSMAPDLDYRFGLVTETQEDPEKFTEEEQKTLYGRKACELVSKLREDGQMETSAFVLANYTLMSPDITSKLAHKIFVVLNCDHPLAPTKSLLKIPGVTVLGVPSGNAGLHQVLTYAKYNTPDDTCFCYPSIGKKDAGGGSPNMILSRGPHVAQWILANVVEEEHQHPDSELVIVPMPLHADEHHVGPSEAATRFAASSDLIVQRVLRARGETMKCIVWSYQSSTTCMAIPAASHTWSTDILNERPRHEAWLHQLSLKSVLTPPKVETEAFHNPAGADISISFDPKKKSKYTPHEYSIVNGVLTCEGPHHILSEHIRMWRAMVTQYPDDYHRYNDDEDDDDYSFGENDDEEEAEYKQKKHVAQIFAPYVPLVKPDLVSSEDARILDPLKIFNSGLAASLMTAISIAGLLDPIVNRPMPILDNAEFGGEEDLVVLEQTTPFAMFWNGSVHGGIWNCPYTLDSVSGISGYVLGTLYQYYHKGYGIYQDYLTEEVEAKEEDAVVDAVPEKEETVEMPEYVRERLELHAI